MKTQIEKVSCSIFIGIETCCLVNYLPAYDQINQTNFCDEEIARKSKTKFTTGIWKPKQQPSC